MFGALGAGGGGHFFIDQISLQFAPLRVLMVDVGKKVKRKRHHQGQHL